jgi:hypothetical protein
MKVCSDATVEPWVDWHSHLKKENDMLLCAISSDEWVASDA